MIFGQYIQALQNPVLAGAPLQDVFVGPQLVVIGSVPETLRAHTVLLEDALALPDSQCLVRVVAYLDGQGLADAGQIVRGVIYDDDGNLVAAGVDVIVAADAPPAWVPLPFPDIGRLLAADSYQFGIHAGVTDQGAHFYIAETGGGITAYAGHPFTSGAPASVAGGVRTATPAMMYLETLAPLPAPTNVDDDYLATLPFDVAQRLLNAGGPIRGTRRSTVASWYGNTFDAIQGSNAIVRSNGPLSALVGERLRVTRRTGQGDRSVAVYIHDERSFPDELVDEQILLSARAFLALGNQALDELAVTVEVLA